VIIVHTNKDKEEVCTTAVVPTEKVVEQKGDSEEIVLNLRRLLLLFGLICIGLFLITLLVVILK
jgi:phosphoribosylaminoimidazole carboxylase (NCAIR synthetase)